MSDKSSEQARRAPAERGEKPLERRGLVGQKKKKKRVKYLIYNTGKTAAVQKRKKEMNYTRVLPQHNSPTLHKQTHDPTHFLCKC